MTGIDSEYSKDITIQVGGDMRERKDKAQRKRRVAVYSIYEIV